MSRSIGAQRRRCVEGVKIGGQAMRPKRRAANWPQTAAGDALAYKLTIIVLSLLQQSTGSVRHLPHRNITVVKRYRCAAGVQGSMG